MHAALLVLTALMAATDPEPAKESFRVGRASLEIGALLGLGFGWYQWQIELNKDDFDFDRTPADQWRRLSDQSGYRFDSNHRYLNVGHSFMGAAYYQAARTSHASMAQGALFSMAASTLWEVGVEHREVISINDQLVTPLAGVPVGEALFAVGEVFARSAPTFRNRLMMTIFSPVRGVNWAFGDTPRPSSDLDSNGIDATTPHRFDLSMGASAPVDRTLGTGSVSTAVRLDAEVLNYPGYAREGARSGWVRGGESTRTVLDYVAANDRSGAAFAWTSSATFLGHHAHDLARPDAVSRRGHSRFLGTKTAFDLVYQPSDDVPDFMMLVHVLGPSLDWTWYRNDLTVRATIDAVPDFAMVRPRALPSAVDRASLEGGKTTLRRFDYYYGWGLTAAMRLEATYRFMRSGVEVDATHIGSIEGLDRYQDAYVSPTGMAHEAIKDDSHLSDNRMKGRAFIEGKILSTDLKLGASVDLLRRSGTWKGQTSQADDVRLSLHLAYSL